MGAASAALHVKYMEPKSMKTIEVGSNLSVAATSLLFATLPSMSIACATCGCSLSTDAAMGYSSDTGFRVNLQYDFIDQDQLRSGTGAISAAQLARINDAGGHQEVEHQTFNRYTTLGFSYAATADWSVKLQVPYIDRGHTTYGSSGDPLIPADLSGATIAGLGDIRLIASYQGLLPTHNLGIQVGVKLPTGAYGGGPTANESTVGRGFINFGSGPNAGSPVDTSLEPGTGSTDLIVGSYFYQPISQDFDFFVNGQFQAAVAEKLDQPGADFRPGNTGTVSLGVRYEADPRMVPQVQLNITRKSADQGFLADTTDTAGTVAYLSPGVTMQVVDRLYAYGFVQLPIYSKLSGYQLFPHWTATVGASYSF